MAIVTSATSDIRYYISEQSALDEGWRIVREDGIAPREEEEKNACTLAFNHIGSAATHRRQT